MGIEVVYGALVAHRMQLPQANYFTVRENNTLFVYDDSEMTTLLAAFRGDGWIAAVRADTEVVYCGRKEDDNFD